MKYCVLCGAALQLKRDMEVHVTVEHLFFLILYIVFIDETINMNEYFKDIVLQM